MSSNSETAFGKSHAAPPYSKAGTCLPQAVRSILTRVGLPVGEIGKIPTIRSERRCLTNWLGSIEKGLSLLNTSRFLTSSDEVRLAGVILGVCIVQLAILRWGFVDVSGDGFYRALMAYEWRVAPSVVLRDYSVHSLFWFPPYFWLTGALYWLTDDLPLSLRLISFLSSALGLLVLYRITSALTDSRAAVVTVLLVGSIPFPPLVVRIDGRNDFVSTLCTAGGALAFALANAAPERVLVCFLDRFSRVHDAAARGMDSGRNVYWIRARPLARTAIICAYLVAR